jgi:hypothetical protein
MCRYAGIMHTLRELERRTTPFGRPQGLFVDGNTIWMSSLDTKRVYSLDRATLAITWETPIPDGQHVWGLTKQGADLMVVHGGEGGPDDIRTLRRVKPGVGFDPEFRLICPDESGSHLSFDGVSLNLSQWYPRKIIALDAKGHPGRVLSVSHGVCGHCYAKGAFWALTTDEEQAGDYWLTRIDPVTGENQDLGRLGFPARALAFDGEHFWTNHRAAGQLVRFAAP